MGDIAELRGLFESLLSEADETPTEYVASDGTMVFGAPAHVVVALTDP